MVENLPIRKWRSGSIDGAVWLNKHKKGDEEFEFKTATIRRSWRDKEQDIWRDEKINLRKGDIPKVLLILQKIQEELLLAEEEKKNE